MSKKKIGFIATRLSGGDGVSLESAKWAEVLWEDRHISFWYGGNLDRDPEVCFCVPEAHFSHPENEWINNHIWGKWKRPPLISRRINVLAAYLKKTLYDFVSHYEIDILIIENALSIPMHIPLGIAITEFLAETGMPTIAHHHDFYWERDRFLVSAVNEYLDMAFPPRIHGIQNVVINSVAQEELSWRRGLTSTLIPNVVDFENPPPPPDDYAADVREELGFSQDDVIILQPTRVVSRKGIEHAIKLVQLLGGDRYKLLVLHDAGDEGYEYRDRLGELARESGVDLNFVNTRVGEIRSLNSDGKKVYTLRDIYANADLVTYPSLYEGFGNAFLEAVYFKLPVVINRYSIFARDIEPKGFRLPVISGFVTKKTVHEVRQLLEDKKYREKVTTHNYSVATRFYSYQVLRKLLNFLIMNLTGL